MTFVYAKLKLEELQKDDILEIILDFKPAIKNIPENCKRQNLAELLNVRSTNSQSNEWILTLKKV